MFQRVDAPPALVFLILLLATQRVLYLMHVAYHRYAWMWPIHAVAVPGFDYRFRTASTRPYEDHETMKFGLE